MVNKLCSGQEMLYENKSKGNNLKMCALHFESLPDICIPSLESFGPTLTKLCSGQGNPETTGYNQSVTDCGSQR